MPLAEAKIGEETGWDKGRCILGMGR